MLKTSVAANYRPKKVINELHSIYQPFTKYYEYHLQLSNKQLLMNDL